MRKKTSLLDTTAIPITTLVNSKNDYGIYIGIDLASGNAVYWDLSRSFSPHILVVGPTGSGKTLALATMAHRFRTYYKNCTIFMDVKNEYAGILNLYNRDNIYVVDPIITPLPLCLCHEDKHKKIESIDTVVDVLAKIFSLSLPRQRVLHNIFLDACMKCNDLDDSVLSSGVLTDKQLGEVLETATKLFNVYHGDVEHPLDLRNPRNLYVVNLRSLFLRSRVDSATFILYITRFVLEELDYGLTTTPRITMVIDELWHALPYLADELVTILTRYGRSLGLSMFMATQGIDDLHPYSDTIVGSCGGFISMASPSTAYWQRLRRYLNLSNKSVERALTLCNQGEAVARLSPQSSPIFLYIDPFEQY